MNNTLIEYGTCKASILSQLEPLEDIRLKLIIWLGIVIALMFYTAWITKKIEVKE